MKQDLIAEIQITPIKPVNGLIAFASFVLLESIYCSSVAIITRPNGGYRLLYPTKKVGNKDMTMFYPISKEVGLLIEQEVIEKLEDVMSRSNDRYCRGKLI
jgi:hypothetical protein